MTAPRDDAFLIDDMVSDADEIAVRRGLLAFNERHIGPADATLTTFEHQARPFYEKLGYAVFGTLEGYPAGTRQYHLCKRLRGGSDALARENS